MSAIKYITLAFIILILSYLIYILYLFRSIDSTAKSVSIMKYCSHAVSPNYTIPDSYQLGIDNLSHHFITDKDNIDKLCYITQSQDSFFYILQRSYYIDNQIIKHLQIDNEIKQFVILGAGINFYFNRILGMDIRAKKYEELFKSKNITVFEVDLKHTQIAKQNITDTIGWPSNVRFVESDLNGNNLMQDLIRNGYNPNIKSLFLLEGKFLFI